ncbi:MAG: SMI1/KNR4 family protein [Litorimonas sp.]
MPIWRNSSRIERGWIGCDRDKSLGVHKTNNANRDEIVKASMFDSRQNLVAFIEDFSNLVNPPYIAPYLSNVKLNEFEQQLGQKLPASFRDLLLLCNFDSLELGSTIFGNGSDSFLEYLLSTNQDSGEFMKIAVGEIGGIFVSTKTGEIWAQYIDGDTINQNKLADDFEAFLGGYAFIQKNRMEKTISLKEAAKLVAEKIGSDDYRPWLHS